MPGYRVGPAETEHLSALPEIERAAAERFSREDLPESLRSAVTSLGEFETAARERRLWTALIADSAQPVGFALAAVVGGCAHLQEMDVLPEHGRRGLGRALVEAVVGWARQHGYRALTLTTFREVPWNGPFYRRLGFRELPPAELTPALTRLLEGEAADGLPRSKRLAMALSLESG